MDKEKQINEITKVISRRSMAFRNPNVAFMTTARKTADSLYNAGYRKQTEVAREIFEEIDRMCIDTFGNFNNRVFAELKKKYTEGKK